MCLLSLYEYKNVAIDLDVKTSVKPLPLLLLQVFSYPYFALKKMAKRTNNSALYGIAERMYVEEGMTAKSIAADIDVSEPTIGRWKKGLGNNPVDWDTKRAQYLSAPHNIKKLLSQELTTLTKGGKASLDMRAINDAIKAIHAVSEDISVQTIYSVFKEFDSWMAGQDPDIAISFLEWHKAFLINKAQQQ